MARSASEPRRPDGRYWEKRLRAADFKHALTRLVATELKTLSEERVKDLVDHEQVRRRIREWGPRILNPEPIAKAAIAGSDRARARLRGRHESLLELLDRQLVDDLDALLAEDSELSPHAEAFVARLMQQEFVRRLLTDVIFTAIVSFYQKVNPFFGTITMRVLEEQIKGFIRLFLPRLQEHATAFATSPANRRILRDFTRAAVRQLLDEPLQRYAPTASVAQRKKAEALIRNALGSAKLDALMRRASLALWDDLYHVVHEQKLGELLQLEEHADWLAERAVEVILPALARPGVLRFVANEMTLAASRRT